jgi:hypothetical protein
MDGFTDECRPMWKRILQRTLVTAALTCFGSMFITDHARAQLIDFGQIDSFESFGSGTQYGAAPPKRIVDDGDRHIVLFTILEANTDAKVYWKSFDGDPPNRTTVISGPGVQAFQTAGEFKLEALGDETRTVKYAYILFRMKKQ